MKKKQYYDISNMLATNADYMLLLGQRANGKSYQAKKTAIEDAYNALEADVCSAQFVYVRRYDDHIKARTVENYFDDIDIEKITEGNYTGIAAVSGDIYLTNRDDKGKAVKGPHVGYYVAINRAEAAKSNVFMNVKNIIFEEFITDGAYLYEEPRKLMQLVSTLARDKNARVIMVGNTLSRVCPYFSEWCLEGVLKQKQGTIEMYHFHTEEGGVVNIAVEYCEAVSVGSNMFFGRAAKQIVSGEWDTVDLPKLPKKQDEYLKAYEVMVIYQSFKFMMQLLVDANTGAVLTFIYPVTTAHKTRRIITNDFSDDIFISTRLDPARRPEALMIQCFKDNKVCYSDNLTGADFKHVNDTLRIY